MKKNNNKDNKDEDINNTIHRIKCIDKNTFLIGDTRSYTKYEGNGIAKNLKIP